MIKRAQNPSIERAGALRLAEQVSSIWLLREGGRSILFGGGHQMLPHAPVDDLSPIHVNSANWTQWFYKNKQKQKEYMKSTVLEGPEVGRRAECG